MAEVRKQEHENIADLPKGFKMTELGPLPEDWQVVRLGDELIEQKQKNRNEQSLPVYTISNVYGFILSDEFFEKQVYSRNLTDYKIVEKGDFAYNPYRVNVGSLALFKGDNPGLVSPAYTVFRVRSSDRLDPDFLLMLFKSSSLRSEIDRVAMSRGSVRRSLAYKDLSDFHIPLPPLPEQRAIAHVLRTVQRAKEATERVIQATRELKKSLMRYLFTYGPVPIEEADRVSLKETEIGLLPEHWEVVRLGEVADIKGGKRLPKGHKLSDRPTPYPYIRVVDFKDGSVDKTNLKYLTPQDYENIKQYTISSRDVYISIAGTIGLVGIVPPELDGANLTENAAKIVLRDQAKVDPHFLVYFLASEIGQEQILIRTTKTSQPKLALARIRQIPIPYPSAGEQQEIARILKVVDKKLQAEEARKQGLEELFKTLLHNLMTGKIRVKDLNLYNTEEVM